MMILSSTLVYGQAPHKFNYQATARDAAGNLITNQTVSLRLSILQGSSTGNSVYSETHNFSTDDFGAVSLNVGDGIPVSGDITTISWGTSSYYLKTEMDETGGTNYSLMGSSQLLSVPYALYSENTGNTNVSDTISFFSVDGIANNVGGTHSQLVLDSVVNNIVNLGGDFNPVTGEYTVPSNGMYRFIASGWCLIDFQLKVNGTPYCYPITAGSINCKIGNLYQGTDVEYILQLSTGDVISFWGRGDYDINPPYCPPTGVITGIKL